MRHRRRPVAVLLVATLTALSFAIVPASLAAADSSTNTNACFSAVTATYSELPLTVTATDAPDPIPSGSGDVTLSGTTFEATFPAALFLAGYRLFLLQNGANNVTATIDATVNASNTVQGSDTQSIATSVVVTINDPTPLVRSSGDETALPLTVTLPLADTTWTPTGAGQIAFTQGAFTVHALIGGALPVDLGPCVPTTGLTGCDGTGSNCTGFTPNPAPTPFAVTTVTAATTTTTAPTTTTTAPTTTTEPTTTTTEAPTTTTTAPTTTTTEPPTTTTTEAPTTTTTAPTTTSTTSSTTTSTSSTSTTTTAPSTTTTTQPPSGNPTSSTNSNACFTGATATYSLVPITVSAVASPPSSTVGTPVTLSDTTVSAEFSAALFLAGYRLFILQNGANNVSATIETTLLAANTAEGSATQTITATVVVTINDPTPANRSSGDESALPLTVNLDLADSTWTPTGGPISFTQGAFVVHAQIGALPVDLGPCLPTTGLTGCDGTGANCTGFTPDPNPDPFASVSVPGTGTTTTTTTTAPTTTTSTSTTTTTTAPPQVLPASRAELLYECRGADPASQGLLDALGDPDPNYLDLAVSLRTNQVDDSPANGESFQLPVSWHIALPESVVGPASRLGITFVDVSGITLRARPTAGATGAEIVLQPPDLRVTLPQPAAFDAGPVMANLVRTGNPGTPIVLTAGAISMTASVPLGAAPVSIALTCAPPASATLTIVEGGAPQVLSTAQQRDSLARTGRSLAQPFLFAVLLLDVGYLLLSATWTAQRRRHLTR